MILGFFIILNLVSLALFFRKRYTLFLILFFTIIFAEPVFQKLLDPTLFGDTFNVFGFDRFKTNLIVIITLFLIFISQEHRVAGGIRGSFVPFIVITIIFHVFNSLFSINIDKSFIISLTSILGPILFFLVLFKIPLDFYKDSANFVRIFNLFIIAFLGIGVVMFIIGSEDTTSIQYSRSGGGLWMSNISTQILAPLFPFLFSTEKFKFNSLIKFIGSFLFALLLIVAMSRTAAVVYLFMVVAIFWNRKKKIKLLFLTVLGATLFLTLLNQLFNIDIIDMYESRFLMAGDVLQTASSDTRFILYKDAVEVFKANSIFGIGIATYSESNSAGFSNVHNIFLNILIERGVIGFTLLLAFIRYFVRTNLKCVQIAEQKDKEFFRLILIGFVGFFMMGLTGNDLFISSGFITGWPLYILLFTLGIQLNILRTRSFNN